MAAGWQQWVVRLSVKGCTLMWRAVSCAQHGICQCSKCGSPCVPAACMTCAGAATCWDNLLGTAASWVSSSPVPASL